MKRFSFLLILLIAAIGAGAQPAVYISPTELTYSINWKWGLVNVNVAHANVYVQCAGNRLFGTLSGESIPWENRIYSVGDTLQAQFCADVENIEFISGWYRKPRVNSSVDLNSPANFRTISGEGELSASPTTMEAVSITANMIAMFYYARAIDFPSMCYGETKVIPISAPYGSPEQLEVVYDGSGKSAIDGVTNVYNLTLNYVYNGVPSAYPVKCQIDASTLLPIYFAADISIGHVQMHLVC